MGELQLNFDYGEIVEKDSVNRRRARTLPRGDKTVTSRQLRLVKRNKCLVARYYYWTEIKRRRFDDVMKILSDYEFFVDDRTISNTLVDYNDLYVSFLKNRYSGRKLSKLFPGFDWN